MRLRLLQVWKTPFLPLCLFLWCLLLLQHSMAADAPYWLRVVTALALLGSFVFLVWFVFYGLGDVYRHYKNGNFYEEVFSGKLVLRESDQVQLVVYRPLSMLSHSDVDYWVRTYADFHTIVEHNGKKRCRFKRWL